jgi:hypothetical protein
MRGTPYQPLARSVELAEGTGKPDAAEVAASFLSPPIEEVSLAVAFQPIPLGVIHASELWRTTFSEEFPEVEEQAPIQLPTETFTGPPISPVISVEMVSRPSLPRLWFLNKKNGTDLVQVQADWFARNWRQTAEFRQNYPEYQTIRGSFAKDFAKFISFVEATGIGEIKPVQAEITYINHINQTNIAAVLRTVEDVLELGIPEAGIAGSQYVLVTDGRPVGRLHLQANTALHRIKQEPITVLTITARGRPLGDGIAGVLAFLDLGAQRALEAFVYSTRDNMHEQWRQP